MLRSRWKTSRRNEAGAVAIVVALCMVALCVVAGFVVDLGLLRVDRQANKSAQDSAAMAGANGLVPDLNAPSFHPFAGVCQALNYLKVNDDRFTGFSSQQWSTGTGGVIPGAPNGCDPSHAADPCTANSPATWARWTGVTTDGESTIVIQSGYKVAGPGITRDATFGNVADVTGGEFPDDNLDAYSGDTGAVKYGGCDQIAVFIGELKKTTLGSPAATTMGTRVRSVVRVRIDPPQSPFALLILERKDCQVLVNGTGGSPPAQIRIVGYDTHPGMLHSDSDASGSDCNKQILIGQSGGGIVAEKAPTGSAGGQISTVSTDTAKQSDGILNVYADTASGHQSPVSRSLVSRTVLDTIYRQHVKTAIDASKPYFTAAATGIAPVDGNTWTVLPDCPSGTVSGQNILITNCSGFGGTADFPDATRVIWPGRIKSGSSVSMPVAERVYVVGASNPNGIDVGSPFAMNHGGAATCPTSATPGAHRAQLFLQNGTLTASGGFFEACNTTVILLGGDSNGCLPLQDGTYIVDNSKVCPGPSTGNGQLNMQGNANVEWTAPNLVDDNLPSDDPLNVAGHQQLEDLALWTESGGTHDLGGSGIVHLAGVFAAPNAMSLVLHGNPTWKVENSQFVVRKFQDNGGGVFQLKPSPSLPVAPPAVTFDLVR